MADHLDDQIRSRFRDAYPSGSGSFDALTATKPGMRRARIRRQIAVGTTSTAAGVLAVVGLVAGLDATRANTTDIITASPPSTAASAGATTLLGSDESSESDSDADQSTVTTESLGTSTTKESTVTTSRSSTTVPATTASTTTAPPTSTPSSTAANATTTTAGAGSTTSTTAASVETIESACGSVTVEITGTDTIQLLDIDPDPGFEPDEKNDGPETVEVSFEGAGGHCEIKAGVENGELWSDVDNES